MPTSLRAELIGTWQLETFDFVPSDGSPSFPALGPNPQGHLVYTDQGHMSAHLSSSQRKQLLEKEWSQAEPSEFQALASTYLAYAGSFDVDEEKRCVTHFVDVSLNPEWVGVPQYRLALFNPHGLQLTTAEPINFKGKAGVGTLQWRRATAA